MSEWGDHPMARLIGVYLYSLHYGEGRPTSRFEMGGSLLASIRQKGICRGINNGKGGERLGRLPYVHCKNVFTYTYFICVITFLLFIYGNNQCTMGLTVFTCYPSFTIFIATTTSYMTTEEITNTTTTTNHEEEECKVYMMMINSLYYY